MVESLGLLSQFEGNVFPGSTHSKAMVAVDRNQGKLNILYFSISYYSTVVVCSAQEPFLFDCCLLKQTQNSGLIIKSITMQSNAFAITILLVSKLICIDSFTKVIYFTCPDLLCSELINMQCKRRVSSLMYYLLFILYWSFNNRKWLDNNIGGYYS